MASWKNLKSMFGRIEVFVSRYSLKLFLGTLQVERIKCIVQTVLRNQIFCTSSRLAACLLGRTVRTVTSFGFADIFMVKKFDDSLNHILRSERVDKSISANQTGRRIPNRESLAVWFKNQTGWRKWSKTSRTVYEDIPTNCKFAAQQTC